MDLTSPMAKKIKEFLAGNPDWQKMADELINHGLGFMSPKEHDNLVRMGAISCKDGEDAILCDYPKLRVKNTRGDDTIIDLDGDLRLLRLELAEQKGKVAFIEYTPKKYSAYLENKTKSWVDELKEMPLPDEKGLSLEEASAFFD